VCDVRSEFQCRSPAKNRTHQILQQELFSQVAECLNRRYVRGTQRSCAGEDLRGASGIDGRTWYGLSSIRMAERNPMRVAETRCRGPLLHT
jgi:hypothetical protein